MRTTIHPVLVFSVAVIVLASCGCTGQPAVPESPAVQGTGSQTPGAVTGPNNCRTVDECTDYCRSRPGECDAYLQEHPESSVLIPSERGPAAGTGSALTGTACDDPVLKGKMVAVMNRALADPPPTIRALNWATKILPADNPHPGYYYVLSTAFGPAIDGAKWSGTGEPVMAAGEEYTTVGFWDYAPKGSGATLADQAPGTMDFSRYGLSIFHARQWGTSQAALIDSLPPLTMTPDQARSYFYTVVNHSFLNIDAHPLHAAGPKIYQAEWHDSADPQSYWTVQVGEGFVSVGQGKPYQDEAMLRGDPGTRWIYHGCQPCVNCQEWTKEAVLNQDCTRDADCQGGLACRGGYCMKGTGTTSATGASAGTGAPGSPCTGTDGCAAGLSCTGGICTIPGGPR
ncbi:MAG: hypothetical protein LUQ64_01155 [Methanomicrobiales archaeon]|nr:hypothetical protein [Methanomicrobiales archaeon]